MTRVRVIALVVVLAAVAVAVSSVPLAHRRVSTQGGMVVLVKRWEWLPGHQAVLRDQTCDFCTFGLHSNCLNNRSLGLTPGIDPSPNDDGHFGLFVGNGALEEGAFWLPATFRCTCTDPSHDGD